VLEAEILGLQLETLMTPQASRSTPRESRVLRRKTGLITYFVILPFFRTADGVLMADSKRRVRARPDAEPSASRGPRAVFSRTGDPATGEYQPAIILASFGAVPDELGEFTRQERRPQLASATGSHCRSWAAYRWRSGPEPRGPRLRNR
jgi:hypothetical protein